MYPLLEVHIRDHCAKSNTCEGGVYVTIAMANINKCENNLFYYYY